MVRKEKRGEKEKERENFTFALVRHNLIVTLSVVYSLFVKELVSKHSCVFSFVCVCELW